jgi:hypothetical protein
MSERLDYQVARVGLSLPCAVPVIPGTPDTDAPLTERTEKCHVDAWWFVGAVPCCDIHFRAFCEMAGDDYEAVCAEFRANGWPNTPNEKETRPWAEQHRYAQEVADD